MPKIRVFADTNVILESFRTGCWTAISNHFAIETIEKCVEETLTGNPGDPRHVAVPPSDLNAGLAARHSVNRKELATLVLSNPSCSTLDDGEKHLFAWLFANKLLPSQVIVVTTADKAALVASNGLGWMDSMTSLEDLARKGGVGRVNLDALALQYRDDWLSSIKTKIRLGIIP
jgi:hypothetical protein